MRARVRTRLGLENTQYIKCVCVEISFKFVHVISVYVLFMNGVMLI